MEKKPDQARALASITSAVVAGDMVLIDQGYDRQSLSAALPAGSYLGRITHDGAEAISAPVGDLSRFDEERMSEWLSKKTVLAEVANLVSSLDAKRVMIIEGIESLDVGNLQKLLSTREIGLRVINNEPLVSRDDFISEEESDQVAERLRQLGYL